LLSKGGDASDVREVPGLMNKTLGAALKLEARMLAHLSFPFGLSVIALAEKNL